MEFTPEYNPASLKEKVQDITKRLLALIMNIRSRQDISPETLEKYMGQKAWVDPNNENSYGVSVELTEEWWCVLQSTALGMPGEPTGLAFEFNEQTHSGADMSPVCVPLEDVSEPLIAAGFTAERFRNRHNTQDFWMFERDTIGVTVYLRGKTEPLDATHACVSMVSIGT
ncbi:MAG: hypothetical protein LBE22_05885 [Azoarcus sp.]|jgi:hypothetical protein|nr:hypothetical protein [Azoarcus sp.]